MVVTQVELSDDEAKRLQEIAEERQLSVADLIHDAIADRLRRPGEPTLAERRRRALAVVGKYQSEVTDLGRNHDTYLVEAFSQ